MRVFLHPHIELGLECLHGAFCTLAVVLQQYNHSTGSLCRSRQPESIVNSPIILVCRYFNIKPPCASLFVVRVCCLPEPCWLRGMSKSSFLPASGLSCLQLFEKGVNSADSLSRFGRGSHHFPTLTVGQLYLQFVQHGHDWSTGR